MRVKATFKAIGRLRLTDHFPILTDGLRFSFILDDELLKEVICEFSETNPIFFPTISSGGKMPCIEIPESNQLKLAKQKLLVFQGVSSIFSTIELDFLSPKIEWKKESDELDPDLFEINVDRPPVKPIVMNFDIFARSLIEGDRISVHGIALNFLRRGKNELHKYQYIFAFMNFFLMIERVFGGGQFKKRQLVAALTNSTQLVDGLIVVRREFVDTYDHHEDKFFKFISGCSNTADIINFIVIRRGNIFHNTVTSPTNWSPEDQYEFRAEAHFLFNLGSHIAFEFIQPIFTHDAIGRYVEQAKLVGAIIVVKVKFLFQDEDDIEREGIVDITGPGTKLTNFAAQMSISGALNHFSEHYVGMRLKSLVISDTSGLTLVKLEISV